MLRRLTNGSGQLQALVKPLPDLSDHAHVFVFLSKAFVSLEADNLLSMETNSCRAVHGTRGGWGSRSGQFASLNRNHTVLHLVRKLEQPPFPRARSPRTARQ